MGCRILGRGRAGITSIEFAILTAIFWLFLFGALGAGLDGMYQLTLDDAVRNAARQLRIDGPASTSGSSFAAAICSEMSGLVPNCTTSLTCNIQSNSPPANFASLTPLSMPSSGRLGNVFPSSLPANSNVLVQVACPLPFTLPFIGAAITFTGTNAILATTTVRMEPY